MGVSKESAARYNQKESTKALRHRQYLDDRGNRDAASRIYQDSEAGKLSRRKSRLKRYNLTLDEYNTLLKKQNYVCAICGKPETRKDVEHLAVDHDHSCCPQTKGCCGKCVRGLLCHYCNHMLGVLESMWTEKAQRYLNKPPRWA